MRPVQQHHFDKIARGAVEIIKEEELMTRLVKGDHLRVKAGFDPTAPDLHLGHLVLFEKLRQFQELGHKPVIILGDATAEIGDPSGHDQTRPLLTEDQISRNAKRFLEQLGKFLVIQEGEEEEENSKALICHNSNWLLNEPLRGPLDFIRWMAKRGVPPLHRLLEREEFKKRNERGDPIHISQLLYPVFQAYDSVKVSADIELGGSDQKFNLLLGRDLQQRVQQVPQVVMLFPLLVGTDGIRKMSKSLGNHIALEEHPLEMFGKIMSISDEAMIAYYRLLTNEEPKGHPMEAKKHLAGLLVQRLHGTEAAVEAQMDFEAKFQQKELPEEMREVRLPASGTPMLLSESMAGPLGLAPSKSEARRLIRQKGVRVNEKTVDDEKALLPLEDGLVVQVGRRKFVKVRIEK